MFIKTNVYNNNDEILLVKNYIKLLTFSFTFNPNIYQ